MLIQSMNILKQNNIEPDAVNEHIKKHKVFLPLVDRNDILPNLLKITEMLHFILKEPDISNVAK